MTSVEAPEVAWRFAAGHVSPDDLTVVAVLAREALSQPFSLTVLVAFDIEDVDLEQLVRTPARLEVSRGATGRAFQGVVRGVEVLGSLASHRFVRFDVAPALWLLSLRSDVRLFQDTNVVRVVERVLRDAGVYAGERLAVDPALYDLAPREYCVQFNESDLDFVSRLLEHEGIPYYFRHDGEDGETLVLAAPEHVWAPLPTLDGGPVRVVDEGSATAGVETVRWFDERHRAVTTSETQRDFDFTRPRAALDLTGRHPRSSGESPRYAYPAHGTITGYDVGTRRYSTHDLPRLARVRAEEHLTRAHVGSGVSELCALAPGRRFDLVGHSHGALDRTYLATAVEHLGSALDVLPESLRGSARLARMLREVGVTVDAATLASRYENRFETHRISVKDASAPVRPARVPPRPVVEGPQTARVVGPPGEDIHTDEHGRIKVQFHWDRVGHEVERSSCWIRVAQSWAGGQWGFVFIPRVGMEVLVQFLEGDPDRPLVTGCVYNGENAPPYALPANKTRSTLKTLSTPATGGYNELRFEDAAGREQMYIQAERDQDTLVKHDRTLTVGRHSTRDVGGDERITVHQNRVTNIQQHDAFSVEGNQDTEVHGPGGQSISVDASQTLSVGKSLQITVGERISIQCGASSLTMDAAGNISLSGTHISITAVGPVVVNGKTVEIN